jgi:hypothetical protein
LAASLAKRSKFGTIGLDAVTTSPSPIMEAPIDAAVLVRGFVLGSPSEFAYLTSSNNPFAVVSANTNFPFFGDSFVVPTGERFEIYLAPLQSLVAIGSVALSATGGVYVTFTAAFFTPEATFETEFGVPLDDALGAPGSGSIRGPGVIFRKR